MRISHLGLLVFCFGALSIACLLAAAESRSGTVQVVYESDTRGYYLPCG